VGVREWNGATSISAVGRDALPGIRALASYDDRRLNDYVAASSMRSRATLAFPNAVARFDGTQWSAMARHLRRFRQRGALIVHDDGNGPTLFAGGYELRPYVMDR
jgi:hypothetical protein